MESLKTKLKIFLASLGLIDDQAVYKYIWDNYHCKILNYIRYRNSDSYQVCEDLAQEVMLKICNNLNSFDPSYSFSTWIYTIARNHCIDFLKTRNNQFNKNMTEINEFTDYSSAKMNLAHPEHDYVHKELCDQIEIILNEFSPVDREIAFLKFSEQMSYPEIAGIVKLPEGTVKSKIFFIRKKIRNKLEDYL